MILLLCLVTILLADSLTPSCAVTMQVLVLVPALEKNEDHGVLFSRQEKGWEMIKGAKIALESIRQNLLIESDCELEIAFIDCNDFNGLSNAISHVALNSRESNNTVILSLIGMFCPDEIQITSFLATKFSLNIGAVLVGGYNWNLFHNSHSIDSQTFYLLPPPSLLIEALNLIVKECEWITLSLISDISDPFYLTVAKQVYALLEKSVMSFTQFDKHYNFSTKQDSKIFFVSMNLKKAFNMLCSAYHHNQTWPRYVWIVHSHLQEDFKMYSQHASSKPMCTFEQALEGVILVQHLLTPENVSQKLVSGITYDDLLRLYYNTTKPNPYANILHDAVWTLALALNSSSLDVNKFSNDAISNIIRSQNFQFNGSSDHVSFAGETRQSTQQAIYQIRGGMLLSLGHVKNGTLFASRHMSAVCEVQQDSKQGMRLLYVILSTDLAILTIFTTVLTVLYFHFRNRESIKATSVTLSVLMFIGCYLLLLYMAVSDLYYVKPQYEHFPSNYKKIECLIRVWASGLGTPSVLIYGTPSSQGGKSLSYIYVPSFTKVFIKRCPMLLHRTPNDSKLNSPDSLDS